MKPSIGRIVHVKGLKRRADGTNVDAGIVTAVHDDGKAVDVAIFVNGGSTTNAVKVPFVADIDEARKHPKYNGANGIDGLIAFFPAKV